MEIKKIIIEESIDEHSVSVKFIDDPKIKWTMKEDAWVPYYNGDPIPFDWILVYSCSKCKKTQKDYLHSMKSNKFDDICKSCRSNKEEKEEMPQNGWTEISGHKVQGPLEEKVAEWLINHEIEFQTHGKIKKKIYYTNVFDKKKKFRATFYLSKYDLFLELRTTYSDFQFEKKIEELKKQEKLLILNWNKWENQLSELISLKGSL